ncbi:hypothetical protein QFC21_004975 [Naganishia friedmannii]|uniref:Uncharacterized protein n=1 Tax=Naganishia friedmannii TaxID=89922 RepID=A0ACC2VEP0_9TREE|nr:hypothetical protein QFC21_004975 [Naganishia friedmannii]
MLDSGDDVLKHTLSETRSRSTSQRLDTRLVPNILSDVNDKGHVANEVEIEQIASELLVPSFHIGNSLGKSSNHTFYVQIRGSISLHWAQYTTNMSPRPPVEGAKQFNGLLQRYGAPVVVVNLIKGKEHVARESKLLKAYAECAVYLNHFLPPHDTKKMRYIAWHMGVLADIAGESIQTRQVSSDHEAYERYVHGPLEDEADNGTDEKRSSGKESAAAPATPVSLGRTSGRDVAYCGRRWTGERRWLCL